MGFWHGYTLEKLCNYSVGTLFAIKEYFLYIFNNHNNYQVAYLPFGGGTLVGLKVGSGQTSTDRYNWTSNMSKLLMMT